ncbi:MAG: pantetheine-phosphate adenylyltransferase [Candidatus Bathyarchaeota archaeon]|nr:pantetheine-phosphate adenylyltransferase [Candidatus Bathyarchaeota archaeon]
MKRFKKVAVGGTFDELHKGHKILLMKAFEIGEFVVIGLSSDEFVLKLGKPHLTASFEQRKLDLNSWIADLGLKECAEIVPLFDAFGSSVKDTQIEALVVSQETEPIGKKINARRKETGLPTLKIVTVYMVPAQNCKPISTTRIRRGEINHEGRLLKKNSDL